jgi:hypothetical protein
MPHGPGVWKNAAGDKYVGNWARNKFEGKGKLTKANGSVQDGKWKKGQF